MPLSKCSLQLKLLFQGSVSLLWKARGVKHANSVRDMGFLHIKEVYLPGGGGEQVPSSITVVLADSVCSFTPTPPGCGWFEPFSTGLGSWASTACTCSGSVGSGFFPSVSTGSFPSATASVHQTKRQAGAASIEHKHKQLLKAMLVQMRCV